MRRLGGTLVGAVVAALAALAPTAAVAAPRAPLRGRWQGTAPGGVKVDFLVADAGSRRVMADLVVFCNDDGEAAFENWPSSMDRNWELIHSRGRLENAASPPELTGRLGHRRGVVSTSPSYAGSDKCPASSYEDIPVHPVARRAVADGRWTFKGPLGTNGTLDVYGGGALVQYNGLFYGPPDPEFPEVGLCQVSPSALPIGVVSARPDRSGAFHRGTFSDLFGIINALGFTGHFVSRRAAAGAYLGLFSYLDEYVCAAGGGWLATLEQRSDPLPKLKRPAPPPHRRHRRRHRRHRHRHHGAVRYLALGDSYSSGEGVEPYIKGTDTRGDRCHRSKRAYSRLLRVRGLRIRSRSVACSGAVTANVLTKVQHPPERVPQIAHLGRRTDLVTISIGGNDAGFASVVRSCTRLVPGACYKGARRKLALNAIDGLGPRLTATYEAIKRAAPHATVVVVGYPNLFPTVLRRTCRKVRALFSRRSQLFLRSAGLRLNSVIRQATRRAHVYFASAIEPFAGHEICARHEWVDYLRADRRRLLGTGTFHPNAAGQAAYARIVRRLLERRLAAGARRTRAGLPANP